MMYGGKAFDGLVKMVITCFIVGIIVVGTIVWLVKPSKIKTKTKIKPEIELIVNDDNTIDTLYIYTK